MIDAVKKRATCPKRSVERRSQLAGLITQIISHIWKEEMTHLTPDNTGNANTSRTHHSGHGYGTCSFCGHLPFLLFLF